MREMVKLCDICDFQGGSQPPKEEWSFEKKDDYIRMLQIRDFTQQATTVPEYIKKSKTMKTCQSDDVLIARYGASLGKILTGLSGAYNVAIMKTTPDTSKLQKKYLFYYLTSQLFQGYILNVGSRAAQAGFNKNDLNDLLIPLPPLSEQRHIAAVLDKVSELIALRKRQLDLLDEMVKARFVEMFGDPVRNEKGWDQLPLIQACKAIFGGGTPSKSHPEYYNGNTPWVTPKDMKRTLITDSIDHITDDAIKNSTTNLVPQNSVLMVIRSGILKHTLPVAINIIPVTINQDMKAFITDELISPIFLMYYFKSIESDVLSGVRGVTADNIDFKTFQRSLIPIPPIELQNQFADFVQQVEKSKATVQQGLDRLNLLKSALMQEYFG